MRYYQEALDALNRVSLTHKEERRLQKRLIKHKNWIFTFMAYPDVPPDNNSSERAIKAAKVKDKVSGGFRSVQGARRFAQLLSLTQTLRKQKRYPSHIDSYLQGDRECRFLSLWLKAVALCKMILSVVSILLRRSWLHGVILFLTTPLFLFHSCYTHVRLYVSYIGTIRLTALPSSVFAAME
jgi:Transposase IS66 family